MDIISYRGPLSPGGVSSALSRLLDKQKANSRWWYFADGALMSRGNQSNSYICDIPRTIVEGHYRFCNNTLWPLMHDMGEYANFNQSDQRYYELFNIAVAMNIHSHLTPNTQSHFVQDYQLALVPDLLTRSSDVNVNMFWHIPWPKSVPPEFEGVLTNVAKGIAHSSKLGFHVDEYARNFLHFVEEYIPTYKVDQIRQTITATKDASTTVCQIVVQPLGLDTRFWNNQVQKWAIEARRQLPQAVRGRYVLSVDRADYTKGVIPRLYAINEFFELFPEQRGQVTFLQICQRTRAGLEQFDRYWNRCLKLNQAVNDRWQTVDWRPIVWVQESVSPAVLAALYHDAAVMLVNPLRDGLNLAAKEFAICAGKNAGPLVLSAGAGAWYELGQRALPVDSSDPRLMAEAIFQALCLPRHEIDSMLANLKAQVQANDLSLWWTHFSDVLPSRKTCHNLGEQVALGNSERFGYELTAGAS